ncbi:MAG: site-specific DNA-methyltransferase [Candidatus Kryptoniota bacterium]
MDGKSQDIREQQLNKLKELFPEVVSDGKVDWEKLRLALGQDITIDNERYVLNWAGKSDAFRAIQTSTTSTLKPQREQSVDFDATQNIFIEGENLEVLKVLQKSYYGKVKMIYIDPPYNTGNDSFIYPDKFSESKDEYLRRIGDKDEAGYLTKEGFFRKNSKENGQYHSNWLSMMYPRLFLARNLLRDDGVIFVSIDDNEVHNLRLMMNEIFGEENFISSLVWKSRQIVDSRNQTNVSNDHEYVLAYGKSLRGKEIDLGKYRNPDNDRRGPWMSNSILGLATPSQRPNLHYEIEDPKNGNKFEPPTETGWRYSRETMGKKIKDHRIVFPDNPEGRPREKKFLSELESKFTGFSSVLSTNLGYTLNGTREVREILDGNFFAFPKPVSLVKEMIKQGADNQEDDIVLDFFAGSGTTAQAVMELNKEDGGDRKFILVQLPEKTDEDSEAYKAGYKTIADICKERIRRAIKKMSEPQITADNADVVDKKKKQLTMELGDASGDQKSAASSSSKLSAVGFKVFTLEPSNFKVWRTDTIANGDDLNKQMDAFADPVKVGSEADAPASVGAGMAWEILVKSGGQLTTKLEQVSLRAVPAYVFSIEDSTFVLMLEKISRAAIAEVVKMKPKNFICLDRLFAGNDQLKTNTALQMKDARIEFKTV